jgi:hypothetical protein
LTWTSERKRIIARHGTYMAERMQLEISDEQYLWWDDVFVNHMDEALERYEKLIYQKASADQNECLVLATEGRPVIRFRRKAILAYRFTYAIAMVLPLSEVDLIRHECNNKRCINPRHLMTGDHRENMTDLEAEQAYGIRWDLLKSSTDRF